MKSIYTHRAETIAASNYIHANIGKCYLGCKGNTNYYNVNGIVWEIWQFGLGNFPITRGVTVNYFKI